MIEKLQIPTRKDVPLLVSVAQTEKINEIVELMNSFFDSIIEGMVVPPQKIEDVPVKFELIKGEEKKDE